jgi:hypothetical protein
MTSGGASTGGLCIKPIGGGGCVNARLQAGMERGTPVWFEVELFDFLPQAPWTEIRNSTALSAPSTS